MKKEIPVLSGLLVTLLLGSYLSWTHVDPQDLGESVPVLTAERSDMKSISYRSESMDLTLSLREDEQGTYLWVDSTTRREKKDPDAAKDDGHGHHLADPEAKDHDKEAAGAEASEPPGDADPAAETEAPEAAAAESAEPKLDIKTFAFKGNAKSLDLLDGLLKLRALRRLDQVSPEDREAMGLTEPDARLSLELSTGQRDFIIGGEAYGTRDLYLEESGVVYLVDKDSLAALRRGSAALMERSLLSLDSAAVQGMEIQTPEAGFVALRIPRDEGPSQWRFSEEEGVDDALTTWSGKALGLSVASYLAPDQLPRERESVLKILAWGEDRQQPELLEIFRSSESGRERWLAQSAFSRGVVQLHSAQASQLIADAQAFSQP